MQTEPIKNTEQQKNAINKLSEGGHGGNGGHSGGTSSGEGSRDGGGNSSGNEGGNDGGGRGGMYPYYGTAAGAASRNRQHGAATKNVHIGLTVPTFMTSLGTYLIKI
ncbi:unnamed protein product [Amaranthus hypochondriacus]